MKKGHVTSWKIMVVFYKNCSNLGVYGGYWRTILHLVALRNTNKH